MVGTTTWKHQCKQTETEGSPASECFGMNRKDNFKLHKDADIHQGCPWNEQVAGHLQRAVILWLAFETLVTTHNIYTRHSLSFMPLKGQKGPLTQMKRQTLPNR